MPADETAAFYAAFRRRAPTLDLRAETSADGPFLRRLFGECSPLASYLPPELIEFQADAQRRSHEDAHPDAMRAIVLNSGRAIGRIVIDWHTSPHVHGVDIAMLPGERGSQAGLHMLRSWVEAADRFGHGCRLEVLANNPARRIYARLGFVEEPADPGDPVIIMQRAPRAQ